MIVRAAGAVVLVWWIGLRSWPFRGAVDGSRKKPDGTELKWKQIGILGTLEDSQLPFFIQWLTKDHPSSDGKPAAEIKKIEISGNEETIRNWLDSNPNSAFKDVVVTWRDPKDFDGQTGIVSVTLSTITGEIVLD